jgi:hypothetical protein
MTLRLGLIPRRDAGFLDDDGPGTAVIKPFRLRHEVAAGRPNRSVVSVLARNMALWVRTCSIAALSSGVELRYCVEPR